MKFSIVIPVHNAEKYLNDCIDSIYNQDVADFEIIFVVNGSNDESEDICLLARECHSNIRVIVTDAVGVSSARNIGLREAQGEYIIFVDADDCLLPGALSAFEETCVDMPDMVTANYLRNKTKHMSGRVSDPDKMTYMRAMLDAPAFFGELDLTWQPIVTYCVFAKAFRRQFLVDNGIYFDTDLAIGRGFHFLYEVCPQCEGDPLRGRGSLLLQTRRVYGLKQTGFPRRNETSRIRQKAFMYDTGSSG